MKKRKKRSIIWKLPQMEFRHIVETSLTISEILIKVGLINKGGNYKTLNARIEHENISIEHLTQSNKNKTQAAIQFNTIPLQEILVENSTYKNNSGLKRRLLSSNLLKNKCYECNILPIWNNKTLSLQLDHINGIYIDNRIENLRLLCPNCHSQTDTFAGKNPHLNKCIDCSNKIKNKSLRCDHCNKKLLGRHTKIIWPTDDELIELLKNSNFVQVGKKLGVSDNAIRKRLKTRGKLRFPQKDSNL